MYNIMIVEDDVFYRYEIRNFMDWESHGFTILEEAVNGRDALNKMEEILPDLVLTDISMPEMDGITLMKELKARFPHVRFIVLSSYDDFNFVKDAMKFGAQDYILKYDLKEQEIAAMLTKVKSEIDEEQKSLEKSRFVQDNFFLISDDYLRNLLLGVKNTEENTKKFWDYLGIKNMPENITVVVMKFVQEVDVDYDAVKSIVGTILSKSEFLVFVDNHTLVVLLSLPEERSAMRIFEYTTRKVMQLYQKLNERNITGFALGVSDSAKGIGEVVRLYEQAEKAQEQSIYEGYEKIYFYANIRRENDTIDMVLFLEKLGEELHEGQQEQVESGLKHFIERLYSTRPEKKELYRCFLLLFHVLYKTCVEEKIEFESVVGVQIVTEEWCEEFRSVQELEEALFAGYEKLSDKMRQRDQAGHTGSSRQAAAIRSHIEKNYMKELSLEILSEEFALTPNYLCKVFKNSTGMKLTQYINQVRVEGAKKLLRSTNMKAHEIGETVGFSSASYFSTVFKQVTGMKVSEYKDSL